jgi:predicted RND superfamily exporter protein
MTRFFILLFHYFRKRKAALGLLLFLSFGLFVFFGLKLAYGEDISKLLPSVDEAQAEGLVFSELRVKDKIIIQLFSRDGGADTDADALLDAAGRLVDSLLRYDEAEGDIGDVLYKIEEDVRQQALTYALAHLPVWIDTASYERIALLTGRDHIDRQLAGSREKIASPDGSLYYRIMRYDPLNLRSLLPPAAPPAAEAESAAEASPAESAGFSPEKMLGGNFALYGNQLFTPDTAVALVFLSPDFMSFDSRAGARLVKKIERGIRQIEALYPGIEILFHGAPVLSVFNARRIKLDLAFTMGLSLLFACLLIMLCFRNKTTLPMLLLPVVYGAFFALACMFWLQGAMSLMALGIGAVILGVALSYCLHVITHYKYLTRPERVLREQVKPVILGCLTTIGAFMGLMLTQSALLRDFGLFASLSMIGTTVACLLFLPQTFPYVRNRRFERAFRLLEKISSCPLDRRPWLLIAILIFFVAGLFLSPKVVFDDNLRNIGYHEPAVTRSMDMYTEKTAKGLAVANYAATSACLDSALIGNRVVGRLCDSLLRAGKIRACTQSSRLLLPEAEQRLRIQAWKSFWTEARIDTLRRNISEAAEASGFKPAMFDPFFELLANDYQPASFYDDMLPAGLMANIMEYSTGRFLVYTSVQLESDNLKEVNDLMAAQQEVIVADPFYYTAGRVERIHDDFSTVLLISSLFVLLVLFLSFRSVPVALIAFLPMSMSWYIVLGVMAMLGLSFNLINIVIATFIFGIGVDYSIFVMEGLLADFHGLDTKRLMYHKTAIFLSALVLMISVSSLIFARHPALESIGVTTLIGMTSTMLITFSLQPFLFRMLVKTKYAGVMRRRFLRKRG